MTTKYRIISGFSLLVVLVVVMAAMGYRGLNRASQNFDGYDRLAKLSVLLSDMSTSVTDLNLKMSNFLVSVKDAEVDGALKSADSFLEDATEALEYITIPTRRTQMEGMAADMKKLRSNLEEVRKAHKDIHNEYAQKFEPAAVTIADLLDFSVGTAANNGNLAGVRALSDMYKKVNEARTAAATYVIGMRVDQATVVSKYLNEMVATVDNLIATAARPEGRKSSAEIRDEVMKVVDIYADLYRKSNDSLKIIASSSELTEKITANIADLNNGVDEQTREASADAASDNASASMIMLIAAVVGMVAGILFAIFIVIGIVRVLSRLSMFAAAIANGNFSYDHKVKEGGEIGGMLKSMESIPQILNGVITSAKELSNNVASGQYRASLPVENFNGDFKNLAAAVNTVCSSYTGAIDNLPVSIVTGTRDRQIIFLNSTAQAVSAGSHDKVLSTDKLDPESKCGSSLCFGHGNMDTEHTAQCEATVHPDGKRMDFAVSTSPLHDLNGNVVGFMEIISDVTTIKAQEATMRTVAHNASAVSDRVAAASEELAAQVEQVSQGAEMQRDQMASTASAMAQMNSTVLEVARNASQASEQSELTRSNAVEGANLVDKVVNSIRQVDQIASKLQVNMEGLGKQAENIGGVMNVISDIADQTNLLALNAAIEAARAGEAGRGFAVVADSVRQLAEKTMTATQEVGSSIKAIQDSAHVNIDEVGNAVESVHEATELANNSGEALKQIVDLAAATSAVVTSIATAAEEQSATSDEITRAIEEINRIVAETSDGMVQSSAAVQDLSEQAQELRRILEELQ